MLFTRMLNSTPLPPCEYCGLPLKRRSNRGSAPRFCGDQCVARAYRKARREELRLKAAARRASDGGKANRAVANRYVDRNREQVTESARRHLVDREAVNGLNQYDWAIMVARVEEVVRAVASHKKHSPEATGLDVLFVGDMCSGVNHLELATTNDFPLAEQGIEMGYLMSRIVAELSALYADVRVIGVPGNHPRLDKAPAAKRIHDNMDWVAYTVANVCLRGVDNVEFAVPKSGAYLHEVAGRTMYVWHGDGIRSSMPGVPWGGVMRRTNEIARSYSNRIDHFVLGHFHQACVVQAGRIIMNGALKGTDEWVQKNFGSGDPPTQLLLIFDENAERLTDVKYINPTTGL